LDPRQLRWDPEHQLYCWSAEPPSPAFAENHPTYGQPLALVISGKETKISVGSSFGFVRCPTLAVTGGRRTRDVVGLYDCDSSPGDCGSLVFSDSGVVGLHAGTLVFKGRRFNAFYPFLIDGVEPPLECSAVVEHGVRHSSRHSSNDYLKSAINTQPSREGGLVGMSPAPSDLPRRDTQAADPAVSRYLDILLNPWSSSPVRLPDHVVIPTSLARFVANRTYSLANCTTVGPNFLFGMSNRLSFYSPTNIPLELSTIVSVSVPLAPQLISNVYTYAPGNILGEGAQAIQWGLGLYSDPYTKIAAPDSIPWHDDFGSTMTSSTPFMSAYRTLAMAIRVRIVGLPSGQFMTPGKIYFAQVRCDNTDMPLTEQDFVNMEVHGRASHVSADAVREAGSKTLFYTPDGQQKFSMTSNFLPPPGVFNAVELVGGTTNGARFFPRANDVVDQSRSIIPYWTNSDITQGPGLVGLAGDSANADATTYLFMGYFGAVDGVVLEVDYCNVTEYIPNKSAPGGIEALVQLPNSNAMDSIFATAAILAEARPSMIQAPGDLSISTSSKGGSSTTREALSARNRLVSMATRARGSAYREGFWDFDWLKSGNLGPISWDFRDKVPLPMPAPQPPTPTALVRVASKKPKAQRVPRRM